MTTEKLTAEDLVLLIDQAADVPAGVAHVERYVAQRHATLCDEYDLTQTAYEHARDEAKQLRTDAERARVELRMAESMLNALRTEHAKDVAEMQAELERERQRTELLMAKLREVTGG
jgi:septal ring factor EnvC (AmiA/AmiB activator)